jgi:hypothetical protein
MISKKWTDLKEMDAEEVAREYGLPSPDEADVTADRRVLTKLLVGRLRVAPVLVGAASPRLGRSPAWGQWAGSWRIGSVYYQASRVRV